MAETLREAPPTAGAEAHPTFATLERRLPPPGSDDAELWAHIFRCERCADAALAILDLPRTEGARPIDYSQAFARAEAAARETLAWLEERRQRAEALAAQLAELPDEAAQAARVRDLARYEPWGVLTALFEAARTAARTDPARAATRARWVEVAVQEADPELCPPAQQAGLLTQAQCLVADSYRRAGNHGEAEAAFARAVVPLADCTDLDARASYCLLLARLRRDQGRFDEAVALLQRAAVLFAGEDNVGSAEETLREAGELEGKTVPRPQHDYFGGGAAA